MLSGITGTCWPFLYPFSKGSPCSRSGRWRRSREPFPRRDFPSSCRLILRPLVYWHSPSICPRVSGWARYLRHITSIFLSAHANTDLVPKVVVLSLRASMNLDGLSRLCSSSHTFPVLFLEKSGTPFPWLLNSAHWFMCAFLRRFLAFSISFKEADQLIRKVLAIVLSHLLHSSIIRQATAGSIEFVIFIALLRVPSLTICSNLGNPCPPQTLGA